MAGISIHAPRKGSDQDMDNEVFGYQISIHAPRKGSDFDLKEQYPDSL